MEKDYFMNSWNGLNTNIIDQSFFNPSPSVSTSSLSNDAFALLAPHSHDNNPNKLNFPILDTDPGFAERAAKFSCFGSKSFNGRNQVGGAIEIPHGSAASPLKMLPRVSSTPSLKKKNFDSMGFPNKSSILSGGSRSGSGANSSNEEESTVSEQILSGEMNIVSRKRKQGSRVKTAKQDDGSHLLKEIGRGVDDEKTMKRTKNEKTEGEGDKEKATETEPLKDYIHVRARRGQATDSHSLAERVRREKIGERMKLLQDLVPGCNKVTGKALMLDEIINYVQSLQRQVEFLSMKLASVNPELDSNINNLLTKDVFQQNAIIPQQMYPVDYNHLSHQNVQLPSINIDGFTENFSQFQGFNEDDLHSIVQMGFGQNPLHFHVQNETSNMKVER